MISKKIIMPALAIVLGGSLFLSLNKMAIAEETNTKLNLAQFLAQKLGIEQSKIQTAVDEFRSQNQAQKQQEMQAKIEEKLTQLVKDDKITEAQKQAIIAKHLELKNTFNPNGFKDMTAQERKAAMDKKREELQTWARQQGIDEKYLMLGISKIKGGFGFGMGDHGWKKYGQPPATPQP